MNRVISDEAFALHRFQDADLDLTSRHRAGNCSDSISVADAGQQICDGIGIHENSLASALPRSLADTRNLTLEGEVSETNAADAELSVESPGTTTQTATIDLAGGKLWLLIRLVDQTLLGHDRLSLDLFLEGQADLLQEEQAFFISFS